MSDIRVGDHFRLDKDTEFVVINRVDDIVIAVSERGAVLTSPAANFNTRVDLENSEVNVTLASDAKKDRGKTDKEAGS